MPPTPTPLRRATRAWAISWVSREAKNTTAATVAVIQYAAAPWPETMSGRIEAASVQAMRAAMPRTLQFTPTGMPKMRPRRMLSFTIPM